MASPPRHALGSALSVLTAGWPRGSLWVGTGARLVLAAVFAVAGVTKAADPAAAAQVVQAYQILPPDVARLVGFGLPFVELALAVLLLAGFATRFAAAVSAVLVLVFLAAVAAAWARGLSIDCGCFGGGGQVNPAATRYAREIARDLGLLALAGFLVAAPRTRFALDASQRTTPTSDTTAEEHHP